MTKKQLIGTGGIVGGSNGTDYPEEFNKYFNQIINCGNYGNVEAELSNPCGGIISYLKGSIINCCNKGIVRGESGGTGGIVGSIDGRIQNCYNTNNIEGYRTGGICNAATTFGANVINCYSVGMVTATTGTEGDIIGSNRPERDKQTNCYTKNDTFTAEDLGDAFVDDTENVNGGYPLLYWE